jgi:hypothetical protein
LDEAGFAMTLPTSYGWYPIGQTQPIPYEAPQGRRVNAIGAYCAHGGQAGHFVYETYASVPKSTAKKRRKTPEEMADAHQVDPACLGPIDGERLVHFFWRLSGRPLVHASDWRRQRRLVIVLDNYSVHKGEAVKDALADLEAANIALFYLPSYSPELSEIEPIWRSVKGHGMPYRTQTVLGQAKQAVDKALAEKARLLMEAKSETTNIGRLAA